MSKSLSGVEKGYSNIQRDALGILYRLKKFHHYFFAIEVSIITDNKLPVAIFKKDVATLSKENRDAEVPGMQLNIPAIQATTNIPDCVTIHMLQQAT